jgi:D-alanyl-D-alanine carboxypeptidase/D-alanyl-D-alanine-endopeptidase (penicillin-binding protein 4)
VSRVALALLPFVVALVAVPAPAADNKPTELTKKLDALLDAPDYKHASWGALVVDAKTGETVFARNPDALLAPASVTKLFSCAAALVALGADHRAETRVFQRGIVIKGTLRGDLVLVAGGDLTLGGRAKGGKTLFGNKDHTYANGGTGTDLTDTDPLAGLNELAKQVRAAGVTRVEGEVLVDERFFNRSRSSGSGPEAVSSIMVNDNVLDIIVTPSKTEGEPAKVTTRPETAFFQVDSAVRTGGAKAEANVQVLAVSATQVAVRGTVPAGGKERVRVFGVDDPNLYARALFVEALRRNGVNAQCVVQRPAHANLPERSLYEKLPKLATFESEPLKDTLAVVLKVSHNLYASALPSKVAAAKANPNVEFGLREQRRILNELGVDTNAISFGGGAGGASADHVSARATVQLISGMAKRDDWPAYKAALPVLGQDGTLAEIGTDGPARDKVFAKTGTLIWYDVANGRYLLKSKALAGTMTTKGGRELHFALFVNNVPLPEGVTATREGKALGKVCEVLYEHAP